MKELCRLWILLFPLLIISQLFLLTSPTKSEAWNDWNFERSLQITIYPTEENVHEGNEATFDCRARSPDGITYPEVRWTRYNAPMPASAYESGGRLKFSSASMSDSGRYICSTNFDGKDYIAYAQLNIQPYGPQEFQSVLPQSGVCSADERACGNNECVKSDYICDGEPDCRDRTDEKDCPSLSSCEPNEFKCNNGRCVQKMWLCDGDDDCGDNSDEQTCSHRVASNGCSATEFKCRDGRQCIPQSFHCDGTNDCQDGSDEIGCVQPTIVQPPETNKQVDAGSTFQLSCKAVAVPEPYINWRLNWGPVCDPPRCVQHSEGGLGTLTIKNAQSLDQGAYTCEAINVKGRVLATPDCVVRIVNIPAPEPQHKFRCNAIGSVSTVPDHTGRCYCKSLATGPTCDSCIHGAYHLHEKSREGCLKCFCSGVTDQCRSSSWYRTKDKILLSGDSPNIELSDIDGHTVNAHFNYDSSGMIVSNEPSYQTIYWMMPQHFLKNKLTAYGGELAFDLQYSCTGPLNNEPFIILKGQGITLVHRPHDTHKFSSDRKIQYNIDTYETNFEELDGRPATRENLMKVLADLDTMLIRASHCHGQQSTGIGNISWEVAVDRDTQDRLALEVEQCFCPPGYTGLSCETCAPGYERSRERPHSGKCVAIQQRAQCSPIGALSTQPGYDGRCQCKTYATGAMCDRCPPNTFHLSARNPQGCIPCFCSGVTQQCSSSNLHRTQVVIDYTRGATDQLEITTSDAHSSFSPQSQGRITGNGITFDAFHEASGQKLYWKLPERFLGNKVTSYGGILKYVFRYSGVGPINTDADVILRGNDITLLYKHHQSPIAGRDNVVEVKLFEDQWQRMDGQPATREHLIMALSDLDALLIKLNYVEDSSSSSLISVSLDYAQSHVTGGDIAYEVEQCRCPPGYIGTSCEECAQGYSRTGGGLYLGLCERCECHGHASKCDKEHGFCIDCQHNTEGDQCERCKPGFSGDAHRGTPHDCQPITTRPACMCNNHSPRGCDSFGRCLLCEHNTEGYHCEQCKRGYYGDATRGTPYDCTPCPCPGASDCFLDNYGQVQCRNCPAGLTGRLCDECAPGYTRSRSRGRIEEGRSCEPIGHVEETNIVFVPTPEGDRIRRRRIRWQRNRLPRTRRYRPQRHLHFRNIFTKLMKLNGICIVSAHGPPLRVQIDAPKNVHLPVGGRVRWYCRIIGERSPGVRLHWSKVGTAGLPSNSVQYDGELVIDNVRESDAGQYRCTAAGDHQFATDDATLVTTREQTPVGGRPPPVMVDPLEQTVNVNDPVSYRCWVPGLSSCELTWHKEDIGGPLPHGVYQSGGALKIPRAQLIDAGNYICTASNEYGIGKSPPVRLTVKRPTQRPRIDPEENTVAEGEPARFRCWVPGDPTAHLIWKMKGNGPIPHGIQQHDGIMNIPTVQRHHAGSYICTSTDPEGRRPSMDSPVARLIVRPPNNPVVDPAAQTVNENEPAKFRCWVPGNPIAVLHWKRADNNPLPYGAIDSHGTLSIPRAQLSDTGDYICSARDADGGAPADSSPARLDVKRPTQSTRGRYPLEQEKPQVDPHSLSVNEGDPALFRCWLPSDPKARVKWTRADGTPLPYGASDDGFGTLYIPRAHMSDADFYVCSVVDPKYGPPVNSVPVEFKVEPYGRRQDIESPEAIRVAPQVEPLEQTVKEGDQSQIRCFVPGSTQHHTLKWKKQDGHLPVDATQKNGVLYIPRTRTEDAGNYICSLKDSSNGAPIDSVPARINVRQHEGPKVDPISQTVDEGSPSRIRCWVDGDPNAHLSWHKEDGQLPRSAQESHGIFTIPETAAEDAGEYICTLHDPHGGPSTSSSPATINVRKEEKTPMVNPISLTVNEGDLVRIQCYIPGKHSETLHWSFETEDGALPEGSYVFHGVLTIDKARLTDSGKYICVDQETSRAAPSVLLKVEKESGDERESHHKIEISHDNYDDNYRKERLEFTDSQNETVDENGIHGYERENNAEYSNNHEYDSIHFTDDNAGKPPQPVATPTDQVVRIGEPARFQCDPNSDTPANIHWAQETADGPLRGDVILKDNDLIINSADNAHAGDYICIATNEYGTGEAEPVRLHVTEKEIPPTARVVPRVWNGQPGDKHQLQCITTGSPQPTITWTGPTGDALPEDVIDIGGGFLDFQNARSDMNGDYTCTAINIVGKASDHGSVNIGPSLTVRTSPPGPRIVLTAGEPLEVKCEAFGEPEPEVEWLHDPGPERGDLPDNFKPVTISEQFIRHPNIGLGNAGIYTCRGSNIQASAKKDIYIEVVEPSRIATVAILGGSTQWFESGKPVDLVCAATGSEIVDRIQWVKVDGSLPDDAKETEPGVLHISKFRKSDDGEYECRGYRHDELVGSNRVTLYTTNSSPLDTARVVIDPPAVRVVEQGESIELTCTVEEIADTYLLTWYRSAGYGNLHQAPIILSFDKSVILNQVDFNDQGIYWVQLESTSGERVRRGDNNAVNFEWALLRGGKIVRLFSEERTLVIKKSDPSNDYGVYRCEVEDDDGELIGQAYAAVSIGYIDPSNARVVKFDEKSPATIECPVYMVPGAHVTWEKEDGELSEDVNVVGNKLMIREFEDEAVGMYVCKVDINGKQVEGYVKAEIYVPDTIIQVLLEPSSESISLGDRAWFDCKVTGDPDADITWTKEGEDDLPDNAQVMGNRLLFVNVREDNGGIYKCHAKTKAGPLETRNVLNVGNAKRKRKRLSRKKEKRAHNVARNDARKEKKSNSIFGSWFTSS
ncbi:unnamed protein product [Thelazia callipaeda]|uniref:Basement membrane proteoglycan n=1 Tax=Thelazia callipaeda TaxID=103827 RepID=A0A158RAK9_THECL|nr:unnamed protein product [Thelazia callipaeda]